MANTFNKKILEGVKQKLLEEKEKLTNELTQFATKNPHNTTDYNAKFPELGDKEDESAAEVATYSDNLTLERELESALRDVSGALARIEKGTYGICKYCEKPIDERRLRARPTSSACIDCKKILTQEA